MNIVRLFVEYTHPCHSFPHNSFIKGEMTIAALALGITISLFVVGIIVVLIARSISSASLDVRNRMYFSQLGRAGRV